MFFYISKYIENSMYINTCIYAKTHTRVEKNRGRVYDHTQETRNEIKFDVMDQCSNGNTWNKHYCIT